MTERRVVLLAVLAGLALGGVGLAVDFTGYWNCDSRFQSCPGQTVWFAVVLVAPWLIAIVLLARSRSISASSCVVLTASLVLAFCAWSAISTLLNLDRDYPGNNDIEEMWIEIPLAGLFFFVVGLLATAVVGGVLQVVISKRRGTRSTRISA
jgi:hypothetical protein